MTKKQRILEAFRGRYEPLDYSAVIGLAMRLHLYGGVGEAECQELIDWANENLSE